MIATFAMTDYCCGGCVADMVLLSGTMPQDGRGCSTYCRAALLGLLLTTLFCFTGWIGARYNIYIALGIGLAACIFESLFSWCQSTREYLYSDLTEESTHSISE